MKNFYQEVANQLKDIDISKIPTHVRNLHNNKKYFGTETVLFYIHNLKKIIAISIKDLRKGKYNKATHIKTIATDLDKYEVKKSKFCFYNLEDYKKDFPNSAIEIFEKQKNIYYDTENADMYLMCYALMYKKNRCLEQLIKSGFSDLIYDYIYKHLDSIRQFRNAFCVTGSNTSEITGLKKAQWQALKGKISNFDNYLNLVELIRKHQLTDYQITKIIDLKNKKEKTDLENLNKLLDLEYQGKKIYNFNSLINYASKEIKAQGFSSLWAFLNILYDYNKMCIEINIKPNHKTKNLRREHNIIIVQYNQMQNKLLEKEYDEKFEKQYKKLKKLEYKDNRLEVLAPKHVKDMIEEGQNNHNCVGSYVKPHAIGSSNIFFIRKIDELNNSYITVELNKNLNKLKQAYYSYNRELDKTDAEFINKWMNNVVLRKANR